MLNDLPQILHWWFVLTAFGITGIPLVWLTLNKFTDSGLGFTRAMSTLAVAYGYLWLGTFKILPFTQLTLFALFGLWTSLNIYLFNKHKTKILNELITNKVHIVISELLFLFGLVFWSYIRTHQPDIRGLEKFMDLGFINSVLKSRYLPPKDMWFAGNSINYYWFGHYWTAFLTKFSGLSSSVTYNLMLATIMGFILSGAYSLISTITKSVTKGKLYVFAGILSALVLTFGGNLHTPYFVIKNGVDNYWYPDATRFIGYNPDVEDKTIHEFPIYSFVVSDLHAHLLNLPFVIAFIALVWVFVSDKKNFSEVLNPKLLLFGFFFGIFFMTNTWDFGNYGLMFGIIYSAFFLKNHEFRLNSKTASTAIVQMGTGVISSAFFVFPFIINFESIAQGVNFVHSHSPIWQLAILWGFPFILTAIFAFFMPKKKDISDSDLFIFALLITSWLLIAIPEIIYVKDIYIASHYRANTMFKLTYQAFVMFYLSAGYITTRCIFIIKDKFVRAISVMTLCLLTASVISYSSIAVRSYYGDLKTYKGLSGESWIQSFYPDHHKAIVWLRKNSDDSTVLLEAPGDSYTDYNFVSAYTGIPTVSGWFVHEWLWRGDSSFPQDRVSEITEVYTGSNAAAAKLILNKYSVKYLMVGQFEREKFPNLNEAQINQLGEIVFESGDLRIYQVS